ncbi:MAG: hypothetical protein HZA52_17310 [Planctomycetes bacterium]|nr:hypothetical protein [Planctomycetota bacterium]
MRTLTLSFAIAALCAPLVAQESPPLAAQEPAPAAQATVELLDYATLTARLRAIAAAHPERCSLAPIGRSRANRDLWCLRVGEAPAERAKPAMLVVANLEGPELFSSSIALAIAERAASASDDAAKGFLANTTLYVVPRLDVDAAEARFAKPLVEVLASGHGVDDDRDGRAAEDPPSDVDGDGLVTSMRELDPEGEWIEDPSDPRALVKADREKGERGKYKVYVEGRDLDHDERVAEDAPADAWLNANFPFGWKEHDPHAGLFATDEPGARALCDFVLEHRDLALVMTLGGYDDLVEGPKRAKGGDGLPTGWIEGDANLLAELGKRYGDATGNKAKGTRGDAGSFQGWAYHHRGLWVLAANPWDLPLEPPKAESAGKDGGHGADGPGEKSGEKPGETRGDQRGEKSDEQGAGEPGDAKGATARKPDAKQDEPSREPSDDAKRLKWIDATGESSRFVAWRKFAHPELGEVEIGGFAPYARVEPPPKERAELARKHGDFVLSLGAALPRVAIAELTAKDLGSNVWEVRAALENPAFLPLSSASARRNDAMRPARATLELGDGDTLLAGSRRELVRELAGSGGRRELRWLVRTREPRALALEVDTDNAGLARRNVEVAP